MTDPRQATLPQGYRVIDPRDPYETGTGPFYVPEAEDADFHVLLKVERRHCNASGIVHGGLLMTMADVTLCAAAVSSYVEERAITVSLGADFVSAAEFGDLLEARAEITRKTGSLVFARGQILCNSRIVLTCSAVIKWMRRT